MANMALGAYTFTQNPSDVTLIRPEKTFDFKKTYTDVAYFSWGPSIIGKEIEFSWDIMPSQQFDDLDDLYQADLPVVFDPQDGSSKTYNVEITRLDGKYFIGLAVSADNPRKDVKMTLLILSEVP